MLYYQKIQGRKKHNMKKIITVLLTLALFVTFLSGCTIRKKLSAPSEEILKEGISKHLTNTYYNFNDVTFDKFVIEADTINDTTYEAIINIECTNSDGTTVDGTVTVVCRHYDNGGWLFDLVSKADLNKTNSAPIFATPAPPSAA